MGASAADAFSPLPAHSKTGPMEALSLPRTFAGDTLWLDTFSPSGKLDSAPSVQALPDGLITIHPPILGRAEGPIQAIKDLAKDMGYPQPKGWAPSRVWIVGHSANEAPLLAALAERGAKPQNALAPEVAQALAGAGPECSSIAIEAQDAQSRLNFILQPGASIDCRSQAAAWARALTQSWWRLSHPRCFGDARIYTPAPPDALARARAERDALARAAADQAGIDSAMRFLMAMALFEFGMLIGSLNGVGWIVDIEGGSLEPFAASPASSWLIFGPRCFAEAFLGAFSAMLGVLFCGVAQWKLSIALAAHGERFLMPSFEWGFLAPVLALFFFSQLFSSLHAVMASVVARAWAARLAFGLAGPLVANLLFFSGAAWPIAWKMWQSSSDANPTSFWDIFAAGAGPSASWTWVLLALACVAWMALLSWMIDRRRWRHLLGKGGPA